jgi:L-amino acid N-acyltransferase YncA
MEFLWEVFVESKHKHLDYWCNQNTEINLYALYNESLSDLAKWYKENPDDPISNVKDVIYVIKKDGMDIAYLVSNISKINGCFVANINPIVVNPTLLHRGYGYKVIKDLIVNRDVLLENNICYFMVMIDALNQKSIKLFLKLGFQKHTDFEGFTELRLYV